MGAWKDLRRLSRAFWILNRRAIVALAAADAVVALVLWGAAFRMGYPWPDGLLPGWTLLPLAIPPLLTTGLAAAYLALTLADRSPEAWQARIPAEPAARAGFPHLLIWLHAGGLLLLLRGPLEAFHEASGVPPVILLGLIPALAFLVGRSFRRPLAALGATGVALGAGYALAWTTLFRGSWDALDLLDFSLPMLDALALGGAIVVSGALDPRRRHLGGWIAAGALIVVSAGLAGFLAGRAADRDPAVVAFRAHNRRVEDRRESCGRFEAAKSAFEATQAKDDGEAPLPDPRAVREATRILDLLPARTLEHAPIHPPERPPTDAGLRAWMREYIAHRNGCPVSVYGLTDRVMRSLDRTPGLSATDRQAARASAWRATELMARGEGGFVAALVGNSLIGQWVAREKLPKYLVDRFRYATARLEISHEIMREAQKRRGIPVRSPSPAHLRALVEWTISREILAPRYDATQQEEVRRELARRILGGSK